MPVRWLLLSAVLTLMAVPCLAQEQVDQESGTIAVRCPPGCEVYLDGKLVGVATEEEKGMLLEGVAPGSHEVRLVKPGHEDKSATVKVRSGAQVEVRSGPFVPLPTPKPGRKGVLKLTLPPTGAKVAPTAVTSETTDGAGRLVASDTAGGTRTEPSSQTEAAAGGGAILFLRALGVSAAEGRSVHIWAVPGGDQDPFEIFACRNQPRCTDRYPDRLAPGWYRFKVGFRRLEGDRSVFSTDVELDLNAVSGRYYVVEANYSGDSAEQCTAKIIAPEPGLR